MGAKSPLTGGIKEANSGGTPATRLAHHGIKALIIEDAPGKDDLFVLRISRDAVELTDGSAYRGMGNYALVEKLRQQYGEDISVVSIGPAGEMRLSSSTVASTDRDGVPARHAARGGLGAVLGSKGLKAIVIEEGDANAGKTMHDRQTFDETVTAFSKYLIEIKAAFTKLGTAIMVDAINNVAGLPTRNYRSGTFEGAEHINGTTLYDTIVARGGRPIHACMSGCVIRCSNVYNDKEGRRLTSGLEYETIVMIGANCGVDDLDAIAQLDRLCDDYGIDTIETGASIGVAMEGGLLPFGDTQGMIELVKEIGKGSVLGRAIGSGAAAVGRMFGVYRVPVVKGQSMVAYDPRTLKGMGVTYATSPMGADHTAGPAIPGRGSLKEDKEYNLTEAEGQTELSRDLQIMIAVCDTVGFCFFVNPDPHTMRVTAKLLNAKNGWDWTMDDVVALGREAMRRERAFNLAAGFSPTQDRLPEFFYEEPSPPSGRVFDISQEALQEVWR